MSLYFAAKKLFANIYFYMVNVHVTISMDRPVYTCIICISQFPNRGSEYLFEPKITKQLSLNLMTYANQSNHTTVPTSSTNLKKHKGQQTKTVCKISYSCLSGFKPSFQLLSSRNY